jgi:hypothetical protein
VEAKHQLVRPVACHEEGAISRLPRLFHLPEEVSAIFATLFGNFYRFFLLFSAILGHFRQCMPLFGRKNWRFY